MGLFDLIGSIFDFLFGRSVSTIQRELDKARKELKDFKSTYSSIPTLEAIDEMAEKTQKVVELEEELEKKLPKQRDSQE